MASKRGIAAGPLSQERQTQALAVPRADVARRVEFIAELMAQLEYVPGQTDRELAMLWGLEASSLCHHTAEASRRIRACFSSENADLLRAQLLRRMLEVGDAAANRTKEVIDSQGNVHTVRDPDLRTALQACVEVGGFMGLRTEKHEHSFDLSQASDAELWGQLEQSLRESPEGVARLRELGWVVTPPVLAAAASSGEDDSVH